MSEKWVTVAEAAAALKVHPRTIERRIAAGKTQSRRSDDGQLQVLVDLPEPAELPGEAFETVRELAADQVSLATGSASALVKFAQDDALRARQELSIVRQDAAGARQSARNAWGAVGVMAFSICIAVGWTAYKITSANDAVKALSDRAAAVEREAAKLAIERDSARREAQEARLAGAEASGRLAAYVEQANKRPTTRPGNLVQRIASAFGD